ncbi:hypothetical protein Dimus_013454 [Dionaea muscipula]
MGHRSVSTFCATYGWGTATALDRANTKEASLPIPKVFGFNDTMKLDQMLKDDSDQEKGTMDFDNASLNFLVNARILFIDPSTRAIGLTLNPHLLLNKEPPEISDVADEEVLKLERKFKEGSQVRARILGYRHLEGLAIDILKVFLLQCSSLAVSVFLVNWFSCDLFFIRMHACFSVMLMMLCHVTRLPLFNGACYG